jgi:hypothetical protein
MARTGPRGSNAEGGEDVGERARGRLAEDGFEDREVLDAREGGFQLIVCWQAAAFQNRDDRPSQSLGLSFRTSVGLSLGTDILQTGVTLTLQEIAEDHPVRRFAVVKSLDRHRIGEDSGRHELVARIRDPHSLVGLVYFHPSRAGQPHHPNIAGPRGEKLLNLRSQLRLILARVGILDRQGGNAMGPARLVGYLADRKIRGAEDFRGR